MEVKIARIKKGLTQAQLCKILKISPKKLVEIEKGNYDKVNLGLATKISKVLGVNLEELFLKNI